MSSLLQKIYSPALVASLRLYRRFTTAFSMPCAHKGTKRGLIIEKLFLFLNEHIEPKQTVCETASMSAVTPPLSPLPLYPV